MRVPESVLFVTSLCLTSPVGAEDRAAWNDPALVQATLAEASDLACYAHVSDTYNARIIVASDGNNGVIGWGWGTVTTGDGEQWGVSENVDGTESGDTLQLKIYTHVDGDDQVRSETWTRVDGNLLTKRTDYAEVACPPVVEGLLGRLASE